MQPHTLSLLMLMAWPCALWSCSTRPDPAQSVEPSAYRIIEERPHDPQVFTQGLQVDGEHILESSGLYGQSFLVRYHTSTGEVIKRTALPDEVFAEGLTVVGDSVYMLTWKSGRLFILDRHSFAFQNQQYYEGEGWGIVYDGQSFITSDGSDQLTFRDAQTFAPTQSITVNDAERRWRNLNELEYIDGKVWANVWQSPLILIIDPASGDVLNKLDLSDLVKRNPLTGNANVLNGIAYDPQRNAIWVTGKRWSKRYLLEVASVLGTARTAQSQP